MNPHENPMSMDDQLADLKHADSNNSIPPPPPPIPPVATVESDELVTPDDDGDHMMKPMVEDPYPPGVVDPLPPGHLHHGVETVPPQDYDVSHEQEKTTTVTVEEKEVRGENCCEKILRCLSHVPCGSLIAWIMLLLALGALAGSVLVGARKTRVLLEIDNFLWFMEFTVTGIVVSMFVLGTLFLIAGHLSTDPTSRRLFNSTAKNRCARGFNIFLLVFIYFLCLCWALLCILLATPVVMLVMMYVVTDFAEPEPDSYCLHLEHFGFPKRELCGAELERFQEDAKDVLICYIVTLLSAFLVVVSLVHFLICVSANITHLRDNRFATLNAYETEELRNSKHSVLDTNM
ncbi:neuronal membrane glycoprotein M6-a-like [Littorina saxatilis]|uniref:neuronal membrane glycoprotein M6-a-like n=1 Tax=Littorina saxatilis TaxID=31220 RepID=UPI0038B552C7